MEEVQSLLAGHETGEPEEKQPAFIVVPAQKGQLAALLLHLKSRGFTSLDTIACADWNDKEGPHFALTYILEDERRSRSLGVQIRIGREGEGIATVMALFPQAEIFERELHEMYGIPVEDHPSLGDFMLEDWPHIPPMRREFDTLAFVEEHYPMRGGREDALDVKEEVKKRREEKKRLQELEAEKARAAGEETIVRARTHVGYLHRGFEKLIERRTIIQAFTIVCRICVPEPDPNEENFARGVEALAGLEARVASLEAEVSDLHEQMLASSELIKGLAEQNTQLIKRIEANRVRTLWLAAATAVIALVAATALVLVSQHGA